MTQSIARKALSDPAMHVLLKVSNVIAAKDLAIRVTFEIVLIYLVYYSIRDEMYFFSAFFYYILAIWHSFWGYAGIGHELMHGRVFSNRKINYVLHYLASILVWSNPSFFKASHLHHHSKTFSEDDLEARGIQKWCLVNLLFYATIDFPFLMRKIFYTISNSIGLKYVNGLWFKIPASHQIDSVFILLVQILIGIAIYGFTESVLFNILWILLPFSGQLINRLLSQSQHMGLSKLRELGPLSHSRSLRLPKILSFLYAGMNYHAEHHLIPSIPYYNLAKASELLVRNYDHQVVNWWQFYRYDFLPAVVDS